MAEVETPVPDVDDAAVAAAPPAVDDGWEWKLVDVQCAHCGATNQIHEQKPEWLVEGVDWTCNKCEGRNRIGGEPERRAVAQVLECGHCHRTFDPNDIDLDGDDWVCPGCDVNNHEANGAEQAFAGDRGTV